MKHGKPESGGVDLMEESILLLRGVPAADWLVYLSGAIPFVTALLWFCTDSLRNVSAAAHLAGNSLLVASAFLWKQLMEAVFAFRLHARLTGAGPLRPGFRQVAKAAIRLAAVQPWSIPGLVIAALATLPMASALFFFRGFSLFSLLDPDHSMARAWASARPDQGQVWKFTGMLALVSLTLYVNFLVAALAVAMLSKSFFGIDSLLGDPRVLARSGTIHLSIALLVYLATDVLLTAAAVRRCFFLDSRRSGADILAALRRMAAVAALFAVMAGLCAPLAAQEGTTSLDRALDDTLARREFAWRMPPSELTKPPAAVGWMFSMYGWLENQIRRLGEWLDEWARKQQPRDSVGRSRRPDPAGDTYRYLMIALLLVAIGGAFVIWRTAAGRRPVSGTLTPADPRPAVDVRDEAILADHLPEDSWLSLADELIAQGEYRLALRALYLSGLRLLSERKLITVQRWKSGMEYMLELKRRSHSPALACPPFQQSLRLFELGWYGFHPVDPAMLEHLRAQLKELRQHANA